MNKAACFKAASAILIAVSASAQGAPPESVSAEQTVATKSDAPSGTPNSLEEIVVSARQRSESDMAVPAVVSVVSAERILLTGVTDVYGISQLTPQLFVGLGQSVYGGIISLRGISNAPTTGTESAIAINIDGFATATPAAVRIGQFDLKQVEVLKGPQALFFGKNSPGGVLSFLSAGPTQSLEYQVRTLHEYYGDQTRIEAAVGGPIADRLGIRVAGYYDHLGGYLTNPLPSDISPLIYGPSYRHAPDQNDYGGRITLQFDPLDNLSITAKSAYAVIDGTPSVASAQLVYCPTGKSQLPPSQGPNYNDCSANHTAFPLADIPPHVAASSPVFSHGIYEKTEQLINVLRVAYDLSPELKVTSISGQSALAVRGAFTLAGPMNPIDVYIDPTNRDASEELRLQSSFAGPVNFVVGGYYGRSSFQYDPLNYIFGLLSSPTYHLDGSTKSAFGQLSWRLLDHFELTGGARYTDEVKRLDVQLHGRDITGLLGTNTLPVSNWSPEATLNYRPTTDLTLFAAYKTGFKSGGFNMGSTAVLIPGARIDYGPEQAKGEEIGLKARLFDDSMRLNAAVYRYNYDNYQVATWDSVKLMGVISNAAGATIAGAEFDVVYQPPALPGVSLDGALGYNHARFDQFIGACYPGQSIALGCNLAFNPATGRYNAQNLAGRQMILAPTWSGNFGIRYGFAVSSNYKMEVGGALRFQSSQNPAGDLNPGALQEAVAFVDARVAFFPVSSRWELAFIGRNLTDQQRAMIVNGQTFTGTPAGTATSKPAADASIPSCCRALPSAT
jgi:iron complex outermembrane receptor protein